MAQLGETAVEDKCFRHGRRKANLYRVEVGLSVRWPVFTWTAPRAGNIKSAASEALESKRGPVVVNRDLANGVQAIERCRRPNDVTAEITCEPGRELGVGHPKNRAGL